MIGLRIRFIGLPASLVVLLVTWAAAGSPPKDRDTLIRKLRDREGRITDLSCRYEVIVKMNDELLANFAKASKLTLEEARAHLENRGACESALMVHAGQLRERWLEQMGFDKEGKLMTANHRILAFDGRQHYLLSSIPEPHERAAAQVTVGKDIRPEFDKECAVAILMGLCLPDCAGTLATCINTYGGTVSGPVPRDGTTCLEVRFTRPRTDDQPDKRFTVLLDPERELAPRMVQLETLLPQSSQWVANFRWDVQELRQELRTRLWYPTKFRRAVIGNDGNTIFNTDYLVQSLTINRGLTSTAFKPKLEDGSNVIDERTGRSYIAGNRLSARIKGLIKDSAEEARREVAAAHGGPLSTVPEVKPNRYLGWLVVLMGVSLLVAAAVWQWRLRAGDGT